MLQTGEIIVIALLSLVVLGPRRLPEMARRLGGWITELRSAAREITQGLEAEVADIKEVGKEMKGPLDEVSQPFSEISKDIAALTKPHDKRNGTEPEGEQTPGDSDPDQQDIAQAREGLQDQRERDEAE